MLIRTNSAVCGAGKTRALSQRAVQKARNGERILIVQPTHRLIDQTLADELHPIAGGVRIAAIHSGNSTSVVRDIVAHMQAPQSGGEILLITHAAHERLPWCPAASWHLIYDEVPAVVWSAERNLIRNHRLLTEGITTEESGYPEYVRVTAGGASYLRSIVQNAGKDDVDAVLAEIAGRIASRHWHVYADAEQYANLTKGGDGDGRKKLILHGVLQPSLMEGYKSVAMVGADIGESALAHLWSQQRVRFSEDRSLDRYLRFTGHENGDLITIKYISEIGWSKRFRDSEHEGERLLDLAARAILDEFGDEPFAFLANTDVEDAALWGEATSRAYRLPNTAHGVNSYQHLHRVALLSALNPLSAHYSFLDTLGMGSDAVRTAIMRSALYQAACRISIRDPKEQTPKTIIAPDLETAVWLEGKFPGARVANLLDEEVSIRRPPRGRPRIHESDSIRKAKGRRVEFREWTHELTRLYKAEVCGTENPISNGFSVPQTLGSGGAGISDVEPNHLRTYAALYLGLYDTSFCGHMEARSWDEFVFVTRQMWESNTLDKAANLKFVPARMRTGGGRSEADAISSRMIVLDVDDGEMSPDEFGRLFPHLRYLVINSASNVPEAPRYRLFIPLDAPIPAALYREFVARILKRLNRSGWWSKNQLVTNARIKVRRCHGIDEAKLHAASLLNLPSQPNDPRGALFKEFADPHRRELDVMEWIARGNPRRRDEPVEPMDRVIVVTPSERKEHARLEAEVFEAAWAEHMGGIVLPAVVMDAALDTFREMSPHTTPDKLWDDIRSTVAWAATEVPSLFRDQGTA